MRRLTKKIVVSLCGIIALLAAASSASAQSDAEVFDSCKPHDWEAFAAAVARDDMATLRQMMDDPEMRRCDVLATTARVLVCEADPLACIEPAAGHDPVGDVPPPPTCPPGAQNCVADSGTPPPPSTGCPPGAQNCVADDGGLPPTPTTDCPVGQICMAPPACDWGQVCPPPPTCAPGQICMAPPAADPRFFGDAGPFPGQRPGEAIGIERDHNEPGNGGNAPGGGSNGGGGGSSGTSGGGFAPI